jgi:anaerobic magnesium-protoporphyrin IX monomethyl ester cyclase
MKIVLAHGYFIEDDPKEKEIMRPYPPLGILYISAYLEEQGYPNEVFDSTFSSIEKLQGYLLQQRPVIVGLYTNLMTKLNVLKIISFIKNHPTLQKTKIILGGPEVRNHAENFLKHGADILVVGEGEETMLEVVQAIDQGKNFNEIKGIIYQAEEGEIITTTSRALLKNLDDLPLPARNKIDLSLYFNAWKNKHGHHMLSVSTMRGCPYTCKWCSRSVYGMSYRRRSPEKVAEELWQLYQDYNPDMLWFVDDVFTISHKWLASFAEELKKRDFKIPYECISRADRMNEEVIRHLKETGCFRVWIGAESGSQKIIDAMDRRVKVEQVRDMIQLTRAHGIQAGTFIMLGYPGETEEDINETIEHLKKSDPDQYTITVAYPIKGTPLYEEVESDFTQTLSWDSSTDRDIDFKRTYNRKYYDYAVRRVYNEVAIHKEMKKTKRNHFKLLKLRAKSSLSLLGMTWQKRLS